MIADPRLDMPEVSPACEYLLGYLFEVGQAPGGNELTHVELRAWQDNTGVVLDEFEATTLKLLSRAYLAMLHEARDPKCEWPAKREWTREEKIAESIRVRNRRTKGNQ